MVGATTGVVLVTGLVAVVGATETTLAAVLWVPLALLLYPLSAVVGYDLATGGGMGAGEGAWLRAGGYAVALATAHAAYAAGAAIGVAADLHRLPALTVACPPLLGRGSCRPVGRRAGRTDGTLVTRRPDPRGTGDPVLRWWLFYAAMSTYMDLIDS